MTKKGEPTGVDRDDSDVGGSERGATGRETRWQKQAHGAGLQGPTGTWGAGPGRKYSECGMGGGGQRNKSLFGHVVQDRNEGGKSGVKER